MTEFIPGAGPPPHKIPSLTLTSFQQQGARYKRERTWQGSTEHRVRRDDLVIHLRAHLQA
jgi:hypothetical protein